MNYELIDKKKWSTNLYDCDSESCFLSCIVPCHVYSKLKIISKNKNHYFVHLFVYILLYLSIQQLWYTRDYLSKHTCPQNLIDNCINSLNICEDNYMIIDDTPFSCGIKGNLCIYNDYECISEKQSNKTTRYLIIVTSISYACLTFLHYSVRKHIKNVYQINGNVVEDVIAVTCCSTCGLAQEYREL
jgi:Cys-rich protein (TIGR01571 family)